jgi:hypothetical protein
MDRDELGALWLRWYVHRDDPSEPVDLSTLQSQPDRARQLRVRDVADEQIWTALSVPDPNQRDQSHTQRIEHYQDRYYKAEVVAFSAPAWITPEGPVLIDGAHRACAIYLLDPKTLDADVAPFPLPEGFLDVMPGPRGS